MRPESNAAYTKLNDKGKYEEGVEFKKTSKFLTFCIQCADL